MSTQLLTSHISTYPPFRFHTITDLRTYLQRIDLPYSSPLHCPNVLHITGTKGKGSTANYCDTYIRQRYPELVVGLYTSPHLCNVCERIRINGKPIPESIFNNAYWKVRNKLNKYKNRDNLPALPGFFRMITLMSLYIFAHVRIGNKALDIMILEVGLGGRYDATNVLNHDNTVCGVTFIDYDHVRVLGKTLESIAFEKGGIFKKDKGEKCSNSVLSKYLSKNTCFTIGSNPKNVLHVLQQCAIKEGYELEIISPENRIKSISANIYGHQRYNHALAIAMSNALLQSMNLEIKSSSNNIHINNVIVGRNHSIPIEVTNNIRINKKKYDIILHCDGAHTPKSIKYCMEWFKYVTSDQNNTGSRILVFHCSMDKNPVLLLDEIVSCNLLDGVYFCQPDLVRCVRNRKCSRELFSEAGMEVSYNKEEIDWYETLEVIWGYFEDKYGVKNIDICKSKNVNDVIHDIKNKYDSRIDVCVTGSFYLVGSVLKEIGWDEKEADCYLGGK